MNVFSKFFTRFCLLVLILNPPSLLAQNSTPEWTRTLNSRVNGGDRGRALTRDNAGNLWVYGELTVNTPFPTLMLRKFDPNQTLLWEKTYRGTLAAYSSLTSYEAIDVQVDANGNAYTLSNVLGFNPSDVDMQLRKYDPNGGVVWTQRFDVFGNADNAYELHVDAGGTATIFGHTNYQTHAQLVVLRYATNGSQIYQYGRSASGITQIPQDMIVTDDGSVIITGGNGPTAQSGSNLDFSLTLIDTAGVAVWDTLVGNIGPQGASFFVYELAMDAAGDIYALARKSGFSGDEVRVYKFSQAGAQLDSYISPTLNPFTTRPKSLAVDAQGQVYYSHGHPDPNQIELINLVKLDQNLDLQWEIGMDSALVLPHDQRHSLQWAPNGNLVTIGQIQFLQGTTTQSNLLYLEYDTAGLKVNDLVWNGPGDGLEKVGEYEIAANGMAWISGVSSATFYNQDFAAIRLDPSGGPHWTDLKDSETNGRDEVKTITVDPSGHVWVGGHSQSIYPPTSAFMGKYDPSGNLVWDTLFDISDRNLYLNQLIADANGNVYALANSTDYLYLMKFSPQGSILWMDDIPKGSARFFSAANASLVEGPNGNVYLGQNLVKDLSHTSWFLASYAPNGTQNWTWESPSPLIQDHSVINRLIPFNGGVVAGGKLLGVATALYIDGSGVLVNSIAHNLSSSVEVEFALDPAGNPVFYSNLLIGGGVESFLVKYDQAGNLLFQKDLDNQSPNYNIEASVIKVDANANIYLGGYSNSYLSFTGKYNPNGDLIWDQIGVSNGPSRIGVEDILLTPDGGLFLAGRFPQSPSVAMVARNDQAGNPTWYHHHLLGDYTSSEGRLLANGPGGELYMAGNALGDTLFGDFLLVKISQITSNEAPIASGGLLLYPNPCQDRIIAQRSVGASEAVLQVIDLQGRVLLSKDVPAHELETVVNTSSLSAGLYFIRMECAGVETLVQKFRVE